MINILGMAGSLRKDSYNKAALRAARQETPPDAKIEIFDLEDISLFSQDIENQPSQAVKIFKEKIGAADAILFVTPEYNYSISGVLKNAIDWGSRPFGNNSWNSKPAAIISASPGLLGGARAQYHLRQILVTLNMFALNFPEIMISAAHTKFDGQGNLTDEETRKRIRQLVQALVDWTKKLKS
jgi:chromate reductase